MPAPMDRERLEGIVTALADRLEGEWLLVGGALVSLWLESRRVTEDVVLVAVNGRGDEGARGTVYRPSPTLFLLLKIHRLSAQDLDDCRSLLRRVRSDGVHLDRTRVRAAIEALPVASETPVSARRRELIEALEEEAG